MGLQRNPRPAPVDLAEAGYVAPAWPSPWGLAADPVHQLILNDELDAAGIDPHAHNPIGIGWAGPTILAAGTTGRRSGSCSRSCGARSCGVSCSPSREPGRISPVCPRGPSGMATSRSSTVKRFGPPGRGRPTTGSSSLAPARPRQNRGFRTSSARCASTESIFARSRR